MKTWINSSPSSNMQSINKEDNLNEIMCNEKSDGKLNYQEKSSRSTAG